jgi:hypothetical protein
VKKQILMVLALTALVALVACSGMQIAKTTVGHPPLSDQEMLIPCSECHQKVTPDVYTEWYDSTHGIGNVKCYQCHGTYENLLVTPDMTQSCDACHTDKMGDHTGTQTCWDCHGPHNFMAN